uniref:Uncharacterized protein n=1 Tax=Trichogramma kaykai TaxID=54128 RepID=A0ABD2X084_9HYME
MPASSNVAPDRGQPVHRHHARSLRRENARVNDFAYFSRSLGCNKFCGLMDLSSGFVIQATYDFYVKNILECSKTVTDIIFSLAVKEEKNLTCEENEVEKTRDRIVSGDGTWKKHGFSDG